MKFLILNIFIISSVTLSGCSTIGFSKNKSGKTFTYKALDSKDRQNLVKHAKDAVGKGRIKVGPKNFRADCSGIIRALFAQSRLPLGGVLKTKDDNDVKAIYRFVRKYGQITKNNPTPGDLIFFHNTYDRNRSGLMDSPLTHIGMVEKIEDGTVYFIHHLGELIIRSRMNLSLPNDAVDKKTGERVNHILRRAQGNYPAFTAAELFAGFGRL